jgi:Domain of unknown function (DUF4864)
MLNEVLIVPTLKVLQDALSSLRQEDILVDKGEIMRFIKTSCFAVIMLFVSLQNALAGDPAEAARSVIQSQIEAFLKSDAETAYSFASPSIQKKFPDKETFFSMVKEQYGPVYHPGNYAFGRNKIMEDGSTVFQEVLITGTDGKDWTAFYQLTRQPDGTFRINGVSMIANTTSSGI